MKKSLLALAVLGAFAASAHAQSSVTVYGSIDAGIRHTTDADVNGDDLTAMQSGIHTTSRIGFRGTEDLGSGLKARFTLENGFLTDTGNFDNTPAAGGTTRLFNRTASVGLAGAWGSVDLGRQYTVAFRTIGGYDPFNYKYTGIIPLAGADVSAGTRFDNNIQYTGAFGPVTVRAEYALGERTTGFSDGSAAAVGATYAAGPFSVGAAYTKRNDLGGVGLDNDHWTVGGAYKFGPARVALGYAQHETDGLVVDNESKHAWVGVSYAITPAAEITGAYYRSENEAAADSERDLFIVSGTYALSKRTNLYLEYDYSKFDGAAYRVVANQEKRHGVSFGVNHLF